MPTGKTITITVIESVVIHRSREVVWDFTQDYALRCRWDPAVRRAEVLSHAPQRVRMTVRGLGRLTLEYRRFRRPERTTLRFLDVSSAWVAGGGGSWSYAPVAAGTRWTQTNSLVLKHPRVLHPVQPLISSMLRWSTRRSMLHAKRILEVADCRPRTAEV